MEKFIEALKQFGKRSEKLRDEWKKLTDDERGRILTELYLKDIVGLFINIDDLDKAVIDIKEWYDIANELKYTITVKELSDKNKDEFTFHEFKDKTSKKYIDIRLLMAKYGYKFIDESVAGVHHTIQAYYDCKLIPLKF